MAFPATVDDLHTAIPAEVTPGSEGHYGHHRDLATAVEAVEAFVLPAARLVDLGVVEVADLLAGPVTLYTPGAGEVVLSGSLLDTYTLTDLGQVTLSAGTGNLAFINNSGVVVGYGVPATASPIIATLSGSDGGGITGAWVAATAYAANAAIIANGTVWYTDGGTSGGSEPDWATNAGATVADNGMTWTDTGVAPPATGSAHFYALVATP